MSDGNGARKRKIAILGGGVGAMSAAYALTSQPGWSDEYEVTVYQLGWRLGGKGASGRERACGDRILEHGLHIWFGFYDNAFAMMQAAYEECRQLGLSPGSPFASWTDAFKPQNLLTAMEPIDGDWRRWDINYDIHPGQPGQGESHLGTWEYVRLILKAMVEQFEEVASPGVRVFHAAEVTVTHIVERVENVLVEAVRWVKTEISGPEPGRPQTDLHRANAVAQSLPSDPHQHTEEHHNAILWLLDSFMERFERHAQGALDDDDLRRTWILLDLGASMVRGVILDGVLKLGFQAIDQYDAREWLQRHGCKSYNSSMVRGTYDLVFAYPNGKVDAPNFAAGTALRAVLRILFDYKGSITYKMQAGMGDTIFSPLHLLLKHRGVKIEYFHKVTNLGLSADRTTVDTIAIDVQARPTAEAQAKGGYDPLVTVKGLPCWPSEPLYEQLENGAALKGELDKLGLDLESYWYKGKVDPITLKRGVDFDDVVLGISLGALKIVAPELIAASPKWRDMVEKIPTVETQAFQVWFSRSADEMGWIAKERAVVGAYVEPVDTWSDMTQVLDKEDWPAGDGVKNVSYFCTALECPDDPPLDDPTYPAKKEELVKSIALDFLANDVRPLLPNATSPENPQGVDWSVVVAPDSLKGVERFDAQFWRANVDPTERYVLSLRGTSRYRLRSDESGFENLYLAGDWTDNDINLGCVEAAVMSGFFASRGICGAPEVIFGEERRPVAGPIPAFHPPR